jgi:hypothetical protein
LVIGNSSPFCVTRKCYHCKQEKLCSKGSEDPQDLILGLVGSSFDILYHIFVGYDSFHYIPTMEKAITISPIIPFKTHVSSKKPTTM